nr:unnamed protein product [Spirometra erinaceieuropaei]
MPPKRKAADQTTKAPTAKKGKTTDTSTTTKTNAGKNAKADNADEAVVKTSILIKGKVPVDSQCLAKKDTAHVYSSQNEVYHFMLNQTSLENNNNKYYTGQVLQDDNAAIYSVWFRWGRVGKTAQTCLTPCGPNLQLALNTFKKKFREKTGNVWESRGTFVKKKGLYDMIEQDFGDEPEEEEEVTKKEEESEEPKSQLPEAVCSLMMLLCDIQAMEQTMREMNYDARRAPLGKLTTGQIRAGYEALNSISECLEKMKKAKESSSKTAASKMTALKSELTSACDLFYTRIPHNFGMRTPPLISTPQELKEQLDLLKALEEMEVAFKIIKGESKKKDTHPADQHYAGLHCDLKPVAVTDTMFETIKNYLSWTHAPTHSSYDLEILKVFECSKEGELESFKDYGSRYLLWHGSRLTNWMGILGRGLRIAPPEAPSTGYMFGKGVYFADCASKSANYAYTTRDRNIGLMALCEVSLGEPNELYHADYNASKLPSGKHSTKGVGMNMTDPSTWVTLPDGVVVPCGKIVPAKTKTQPVLLYNEYIVYEREQIRLRYLVQLKFKYHH